MTRREDWPKRLDAVLQAAEGRPFSWGEHDCCTFAADCVHAVTGERLWPEGFGTYASAIEAQKRMFAMGWETVADALDSVLGERRPVLTAQRGDIVVFVNEADRFGCAVVDLSGQFGVGLAPDGLVRRPVLDAVAAWRVG